MSDHSPTNFSSAADGKLLQSIHKNEKASQPLVREENVSCTASDIQTQFSSQPRSTHAVNLDGAKQSSSAQNSLANDTKSARGHSFPALEQSQICHRAPEASVAQALAQKRISKEASTNGSHSIPQAPRPGNHHQTFPPNEQHQVVVHKSQERKAQPEPVARSTPQATGVTNPLPKPIHSSAEPRKDVVLSGVTVPQWAQAAHASPANLPGKSLVNKPVKDVEPSKVISVNMPTQQLLPQPSAAIMFSTTNPQQVLMPNHAGMMHLSTPVALRSAVLPSMSRPNASSVPTMAAGHTNSNQTTLQIPSISREIAKLVSNYLESSKQRGESFGVKMPSLRDRLETESESFDSNRNLLAWNVRDSIRTEFFRVKYPMPPSTCLLLLVTQCEIVLTNTISPQRPFFFPGTRVSVPTDTGTRRTGTTLQLREKVVGGKRVTEAMLHLDGPQGGEFPWVQSSSLRPASTISATQLAQNSIKIPPRNQKVPRTRGVRGGRGGRNGGRTRKYLKDGLKILNAINPAGVTKATIDPNTNNINNGTSQGSKDFSHSGTSTANRSAAGPTRTSVGGKITNPSGRAMVSSGKHVSGRSGQEVMTISVPPALVCGSPPPRSRIIGTGRSVSHISGSLRRTLDSKRHESLQEAAKPQAVLGIERLVARRNVKEVGLQYFVKWSGRPMNEGSWEQRDSLLKDVPGLIRDFDVRHPAKSKLIDLYEQERHLYQGSNLASHQIEDIDPTEDKGRIDEKKGNPTEYRVGSIRGCRLGVGPNQKDGNKGTSEVAFHYKDDVTGLPIPSWVDTPILELDFAGMKLQIRRPNDYSLHNDPDAALRDMKKRQSEFKKKHPEEAVKVFSMSRSEARLAIEHGLRAHREKSQHAVRFPRGLGMVSPWDHGVPFSRNDALLAPASWDGYLTHLGLRCSDFERGLLPYMPTLDDGSLAKLAKSHNDVLHKLASEHRERARTLIRDAFRHDGSTPAPSSLFRDGMNSYPGAEVTGKRRTKQSLGTVSCEGVGFGRDKLMRARDETVEKVFKKLKTDHPGRNDSLWYDAVWACWRRVPPKLEVDKGKK